MHCQVFGHVGVLCPSPMKVPDKIPLIFSRAGSDSILRKLHFLLMIYFGLQTICSVAFKADV